ncbi:hypothetical protein J7L29_05165 [Candidatus Bathyarchaeota archaeon]|nr:hypothetical protein [Candidatus Bathyarchaeota archaeon]
MPKYKVNVFYVISLICTLILIVYSWFIFLPQFEGTLEYQAVRTLILFIILLLLISAGIQLFLLRPKPRKFDEE